MNVTAIQPGDNSMAAFDVERVRQDFPVLKQEVYGRPLVYLDSGASAQKPRQVLDAMNNVYENHYSNVHRGVHALSQKTTDVYEAARGTVARFINARSENEIIFTKGATEAINLVASSWGRKFLKAGDEVLISHMEHHANIVPWQLLRDQIGIVLKVIPIDDDGVLMMDAYEDLLGDKTKLVAVAHISNTLGTINPIEQIISMAHAKGALVLVDGCQAAPHMAIDIQAMDADFYTFSSHKVYGPTAAGVLFGKEDILNSMPPYQGGGDMILSVSFDETIYQKAPFRFEAGTPAIVEVIGFAAALDYVSEIGLDNIAAHEHGILQYATEKLSAIEGLRIVGTAKEKAAIISFLVEGVHSHDVGTFIDRAGVAVRVGHHCAQPVMDRFGVAATARASFGIYNTRQEVDALVDALVQTREFFG